MPTDTIYGLVGSAFSKKAVERICKVRKRDRKKPFIILISSLDDLKGFGVELESRHKSILKKLWLDASIGAVSVIFPTSDKQNATSKKFKYLHRGTKTIASRLPKTRWMRNFLKKTGPLVAPSANLAGHPPARTIKEARKYFGDRVDFYLDGGRIIGKPSVLLEVKR